MRTPRQWATSLRDENGKSIEAELENGGITEVNTVLIVPSIHQAIPSREMHKYWKNQNPTLSNSMKLFAESLKDNLDIPKTVFTQNIDTLLAKRFTNRSDGLLHLRCRRCLQTFLASRHGALRLLHPSQVGLLCRPTLVLTTR